MTWYVPLIWSLIIVVTYAYAGRRLSGFFHPVKMELVDRAEELLNHPRMKEQDRNGIEMILDCLYSNRAAWGFAFATIIFSFSAAIMKLKNFSRKQQTIDPPYKRQLLQFLRLATLSILSNSLGAFILFFVWMALAIVITLPVKEAAKKAAFASTKHHTKSVHHHFEKAA
ncbi:hypothetical protein [Martelella sp. HB161492]|uniref:hypothetical protein n=1 Tax=Martelella sp. HB161492 TaxID=2720726 RepID=UPI001592A092|nr:hypothetical protein [Martelella sp. HB161492]